MFIQALGLRQCQQIDMAPAWSLEPGDAAYSSCPDWVV